MSYSTKLAKKFEEAIENNPDTNVYQFVEDQKTPFRKLYQHSAFVALGTIALGVAAVSSLVLVSHSLPTLNTDVGVNIFLTIATLSFGYSCLHFAEGQAGMESRYYQRFWNIMDELKPKLDAEIGTNMKLKDLTVEQKNNVIEAIDKHQGSRLKQIVNDIYNAGKIETILEMSGFDTVCKSISNIRKKSTSNLLEPSVKINK